MRKLAKPIMKKVGTSFTGRTVSSHMFVRAEPGEKII